MKHFFILLVVCSLAFAGCYYDKTDELNPGVGLFTPCDTTHPVSYQRHIVPILTNYCYACHKGTNPSSGYHLDDYASVQSQAASGNLWSDLSGGSHSHQMPPSFKLDSCYYKQFDYWINIEQAPNN